MRAGGQDHRGGLAADGRLEPAIGDLGPFGSPCELPTVTRHPGFVHRCGLTGGSVAHFDDHLDFHRRVHGSSATPIALRACLPSSPNTSMSQLARR